MCVRAAPARAIVAQDSARKLGIALAHPTCEIVEQSLPISNSPDLFEDFDVGGVPEPASLLGGNEVLDRGRGNLNALDFESLAPAAY